MKPMLIVFLLVAVGAAALILLQYDEKVLVEHVTEDAARTDRSKNVVDSDSNATITELTPGAITSKETSSDSGNDNKIRRIEKVRLPSGRLIDSYVDLRRAAEAGSAESALALSKALGVCATVPRSREEQEELIAATQRKVATKDDVRIADLGAEIQHMAGRFDFCAGISNDTIDQTAYWLERAANLGSLEAKTFFLSTAIPSRESAAFGEVWIDDHARVALGLLHLREAADSGVIDAMALYGMYLMDEKLLQRDSVKAAAYLLAASEGLEGTSSSSRSRKLATSALMKLSPTEAKRAQEWSREMLATEKCCITF